MVPICASYLKIGSLKSPDGRLSPTQISHINVQTHPLSMHHNSSYLHSPLVSGEKSDNTHSGILMQNNYMIESSTSGSFSPVRLKRLLSEKRWPEKLSLPRDLSSKTLKVRRSKNMNNHSDSFK